MSSIEGNREHCWSTAVSTVSCVMSYVFPVNMRKWRRLIDPDIYMLSFT